MKNSELNFFQNQFHINFSYIGTRSHKLALLLDYDGTLAPIAPHPDLATLPQETKNVLQRLSNISDVYIAVISGRGVENVKDMVGIEGITYAGNHGLEILHPDGSKFVHPMPVEFAERVSGLLRALQDSKVRCQWYLLGNFLGELSC